MTIDNKIDNVVSLTYAKMLIRTKAQNKIDARIRVQYENGSCEAWIKECMGPMKNQSTMNCGDDKSQIVVVEHLNMQDPEPYSHGCSTSGMPPYQDPILLELLDRKKEEAEHVWIDPMDRNETQCWYTVSPLVLQEPQPLMTMVDNSSVPNPPKTPRGRPRKSPNTQLISLSASHIEARNTWETAKLLGISSSDEGQVVAGLRKSKRLLLMDGTST